MASPRLCSAYLDALGVFKFLPMCLRVVLSLLQVSFAIFSGMLQDDAELREGIMPALWLMCHASSWAAAITAMKLLARIGKAL